MPEAEIKRFRIRGESREIPVSKIHANSWNPNVMDERAKAAVRESIDEHEFLDELLVRPHPQIEGEFEVVDGEHRWQAISEYAADNEVDPLLPARVIDASDAEAQKLTIIMNETRGKANKVKLARLIADLKKDFGDELGRGLAFEQSELDELVALAAHSWEGYEDGSFADDGWRRFVAAMTAEDYEAYQEARNLVAREAELTGDEPVKNGQVVAALAAEYLAEYGGVGG